MVELLEINQLLFVISKIMYDAFNLTKALQTKYYCHWEAY